MTPLAQPGPITRGGAAAAARDELAKPGYRRARPSLLERVIDRIIGYVGHAFSHAADFVPGGDVGVVVLTALVVGLVVALVVRLGPTRIRDVLGERSPARERSATAEDFRAEAETLAAAGDFAGAVRATTRAMVRELEFRGVLEATPGSTTTALLQQATRAVPAVGEDARVVTGSFERVWYAGEPATAETAARARDAERRISRQRLRVAVPA